VQVTTIEAKRSFPRAGKLAIAMALLAVTAGTPTGHAQSRLDRQREQIFQNGANAGEQRDKQASTIAEQQKQLLQYQIRKSQRVNRKLQCKSAGLPNC
jgi:hypothetical protein